MTNVINGQDVDIRLRPALNGAAAMLAQPYVSVGTAGPGWAELLVGDRPVQLSIYDLVRAADVAEPEGTPDVIDESSWAAWLLQAVAEPQGIASARIAINEVAVAASLAALPRPLPTHVVGPPRIVLRIEPGWLDELMATSTALDRVAESQKELAARLGIRLPPLTIQHDDLPSGVIGTCLGNLVLPLHRLPRRDDDRQGLVWIAEALASDIRRLPEALVDDDVMQDMLYEAGSESPGSVRLLRSLVDRERTLHTLRGLLSGGVPLGRLDSVIDRLLEAQLTEVPDADALTFVRSGLQRRIAATAAGGSPVIRAYVLDPRVQPDDARAVVRTVPGGLASGAVLLTRPDVASRVRASLSTEFEDLLVLSSDEIPLTCRIDELGALTNSDQT